MKIVLLDYGTLGPEIDLSPLRDAGELVAYEMTAQEGIAARIQDADVVITNKLKLNRQSLALALSNKLITYRDHVHSGFYSRSGSPNILTPVWHELAGKTWGIVGCGNIGRKVADVAKALGCKVLVYRRKPDPDYENADLDALLQQSDVVSVHLPLNDETRGILSREKIALMKKDAIFVNVARGAVADEAALADAVAAGKLAGLGVDVFSAEPMPEDHPYSRILDKDNVIFTPHCAWSAKEARNRCVREVAENICAFSRGEKRNRCC